MSCKPRSTHQLPTACRTPARTTVAAAALMVLALATNAHAVEAAVTESATDGGSAPASNPTPTESCLAGSADACDVAAAAAERADRPALAAHLRDEATQLRDTSSAGAAPATPAPAKPPRGSAPGFSAGRVGLQALAGAGVLAVSFGTGLAVGMGMTGCGSLFCGTLPVFALTGVGLMILPFVSYAVGHALGGRGTMPEALLGTLVSWVVAGVLLASVVSGAASAPSSGTNWMVVGGLTVGTLAVVLGPALGTELFPASAEAEPPALSFVPRNGGGMLVFAHRF